MTQHGDVLNVNTMYIVDTVEDNYLNLYDSSMMTRHQIVVGYKDYPLLTKVPNEKNPIYWKSLFSA